LKFEVNGATALTVSIWISKNIYIMLKTIQTAGIEYQLQQAAQEDPRLEPFWEFLRDQRDPTVDNQDALAKAVDRLDELTQEYERQHPPMYKSVIPRETRVFEEAKAEKNGAVTEILSYHPPDPLEFSNWGQTYQFAPSKTLVIETRDGVCKVVQWAAAQGKRVRVAGFRHSWS
jgi:hypothetical protein